MKQVYVLVVDNSSEICEKVASALAKRFPGLVFTSEKSNKFDIDTYVVKFHEMLDIDCQSYRSALTFAEGYCEAIRHEKAKDSTLHYGNLLVGDVFSFVTNKGTAATSKYLKLHSPDGIERALNLYTNEIQQNLFGPVVKDENLTMNRTKWVKSLSAASALKFGDLEIGTVFYFSSDTKVQYLKTASSSWFQCIRLNTNDPCMCHDNAFVIVNENATDENDSATIEAQETLLP